VHKRLEKTIDIAEILKRCSQMLWVYFRICVYLPSLIYGVIGGRSAHFYSFRVYCIGLGFFDFVNRNVCCQQGLCEECEA